MNTKALFGLFLAAGFAARLAGQSSVDSVITSNLVEPLAVVATADGNLYVTDGANYRVIKFNPATSAFTVLAGRTGLAGTNSGTGIQARFSQVEGLVAARGGLVVADSGNQMLRFVSFSGVVTNLAGQPGLPGPATGPVAAPAATFRYPLGLAADGNGNVFVADSKNNAIRKLDVNNVVTTLSTNFYEPGAVTVGDNGGLWVADTRHHAIKLMDTNGVITLAFGSTNGTAGYLDSLVASEALFNSPRGLLWLGSSAGLLISDSGNNVIRRLYFNSEIGDYSIETFAGVAGSGGLLNGAALAALFSAPVGLTRDPVVGGFLVADRANRQVRRLTTGPPQPAVTTPEIGWVEMVKDAFGNDVTKLNPVTSAVFNNDITIAILAEAGTDTYFTFGPTPPSVFEDTIPAPGPQTGAAPPPYRDGRPASELPNTLIAPQPDVTIKAIGTQDGRRSSDIVQARFQFKVGSPSIQGDNAAYFTLDSATLGAQMWYTLNGSEPTNNPVANPNIHGPLLAGEVISLVLAESNVVFKVRGFKPNYQPSDTSTKVFSPSNFVANSISFGFAAGEASSAFIGSAGQTFYAPVTLSVLSGIKLYSLQFNATVANAPGAPSPEVNFQSMLVKPADASTYMTIPPAMWVADRVLITTNLLSVVTTNIVGVFTNMVFTSNNLIGVGWLERRGKTNLYDTTAQDLITYSMAHDSLFKSADGKVVLGGFSFKIPTNSALGDQFPIRIDRVSGTADGVSQEVYIDAPTKTNAPVKAAQTVTVGSQQYLVGDLAPFHWLNAGDFGNTNLLNNDVMQVFEAAIYHLNRPPAGSDFEDAMNSCCCDITGTPLGATNGIYTSDGSVINGLINTFALGDTNSFGGALLDVADVFVTFRRSLDPTLNWYARYWSNGVRQAVVVPNRAPGAKSASLSESAAAKSTATTGETPFACFSADDVVVGGSGVIQVPIRVRLNGGYPLRVLMLNLTVQPLDGSPALLQPVRFAAVPALGTPAFAESQGAGNYAAAWLNNAVTGVSGTNLIGTLTITLPANAPASAAYRVHFDHLSASPNGIGVFPSQFTDGLVTVADRSASSWNDGIPDSWRLRYFGSVSNVLSAAAADADGDGVTNWDEFRSGSNPLDQLSKLRLLSSVWPGNRAGGVRLQWPTGLNRRYILEYCTDFGSGRWLPILTNLIGDGGLREYIDSSAAAGGRFYRVRVAE
jgi:hypothetical protein